MWLWPWPEMLPMWEATALACPQPATQLMRPGYDVTFDLEARLLVLILYCAPLIRKSKHELQWCEHTSQGASWALDEEVSTPTS